MYWSVRLGIAPLEELPKVWRRIRRAKALARRNARAQRTGALQ
ncbi:hypothetical protein ACIGCM_06270 [Pseudomonas sp. NPDC078700]